MITLAGNFSSLYFHQELVKAGKERDIHLADIASLPYACRAQEGGEVNIIDIKQKLISPPCPHAILHTLK